jgi:hypothetical protein
MLFQTAVERTVLRDGGVRIKRGMDFLGGRIRAGKNLAWAARGVYIQHMRKKRCRRFLLGWMSLVVWVWVGRVFGEAGVSEVKLTGIVNLPGYKRALIGNSQILKEGERQGAIEVVEIDTVKGIARLRLPAGKTNTIVTLRLDVESGTPGTNQFQGGTSIQLHNASLEEVLRLYGDFCERTLLLPSLTAEPITLQATVGNNAEAALVLQKALLAQGITTIPDGKKFMMVLPVERAAMAHPRSDQLKSSAQGPTVPAGEFGSPDVDWVQAARFYEALSGEDRQMEGSEPGKPMVIPGPPDLIHFFIQTPLTREEALYAFKTVLDFHNIKITHIGTNLFKVEHEFPK